MDSGRSMLFSKREKHPSGAKFAGFTYVIALATDKRALEKIRRTAEALAPPDRARVRFFLIEELFAFLDARETQNAPAEATVRGYRVKVKLNAVTVTEQKAKRAAITSTLMQAMRRMKD